MESDEGDVGEVEITALHSHMTDSNTKYNDVTLEPRMVGIEEMGKKTAKVKPTSSEELQNCQLMFNTSLQESDRQTMDNLEDSQQISLMGMFND